MLEENLQPILEQLRSRENLYKTQYEHLLQVLEKANKVQSDRLDQLSRRRTVKTDKNLIQAKMEWEEARKTYREVHKLYFKEIHDHARQIFEEDTKNLASDVEDLTYICKIPYDDWRALVDPILGNWVLDQLQGCNPQTEYQNRVHRMLMVVVKEARFNNSLTKDIFGESAEFNTMRNNLRKAILSNPAESDPICEHLREAGNNVAEFYYSTDPWTYINPVSGKRVKYETHVGDGLYEPMARFCSLVDSHVSVRS